MKKGLKITIIAVGSLIFTVLVAAAIIPLAFKDKIKGEVESAINDRVNARVTFGDYSLSLLRAFPNASFTVSDLNVTRTGDFGGDTLAAVKSLGIVINLKSLFGDGGYEIKSVSVDQPFVNAIISSSGKENWDIMKESSSLQEQPAEPGDVAQQAGAAEESEGAMRLKLNRFVINDGRLRYTDLESDMAAAMEDLNLILSGNMAGNQTVLDLDMKADNVDLVMDKIPWLTDATLGFKAGIDALLDSMKFTLRENVLKLNDLSVNFSGMAAMPGDDIELDLVFSAPETSFKSLLSLIPAFYMKGYEDLKASGNVALAGTVRGIYSSADSTLPDVSARLKVSDGMISYPGLPEKITAISINGQVQTVGSDMDNTTVDVSRFHFELAGNPFDMTMKLATPLSDPSVNAVARGKIDLAKLLQAIPLDSISLNGLLDVSLDLAGRMSMIENKEYDKFRAAGHLKVSDMAVEMSDLPVVRIADAAFSFKPEWAELTRMTARIGEKSDVTMSGRLENYIPYLFSDGILRGTLAMSSKEIDLNEIMDYIPSDTIDADTAAMEVITVPDNIDLSLAARVDRLRYGRLAASDVKGDILVRDGVVTVSEAGMNALGGSLLVNAAYDTRDTHKPLVDAEMLISTVNIKEAFSAFNTVRQLMPAAANLGGIMSVKLDFNSILGTGMMPLLNTLSGNGELSSESVQILESKSFDRMKSLLKINPAYTNMLKDLRATFIINDGRLYVKPFDTKLGNIKLNVSGDQGLDRTVNYLIRAEIPRAELGEAANSLMSTFSSQAAALGFGAAPPEVIKVNLAVGGTVRDPLITPSFAGGSVSSMAASAADTVKQQVVEKVNDAARQQADKILKEAEDKAKLLRDEAASSAGVIRSEADLRGKKLVKDAEAQGPLAVVAAKRAAEVLNREAEKRASQLVTEANKRADQILAEAKARADELLK